MPVRESNPRHAPNFVQFLLCADEFLHLITGKFLHRNSRSSYMESDEDKSKEKGSYERSCSPRGQRARRIRPDGRDTIKRSTEWNKAEIIRLHAIRLPVALFALIGHM